MAYHRDMSSPASPALPTADDGGAFRVVLIDGSSVLTRHFHGAPPVAGTYGPLQRALDVGALRGYLDHASTWTPARCDRVVHVLDGGVSVARQSRFPAYKAHRTSSEPALDAQEAALPLVLGALGARWVRQRGVEADDLIATLARAYVERGAYVAIDSPDKDMLQMVRDGQITVTHLRKGIDAQGRGNNTRVWIEEEDVRVAWGVEAAQVVDLLALAGDAADGVPGVPGMGVKGAAALLQACGTLQAVLREAETLSRSEAPAVRRAARAVLRAPEAERWAMLSRDLVRLDDAVPGVLDEPDRPDPDRQPDTARAWLTTLQATERTWAASGCSRCAARMEGP